MATKTKKKSAKKRLTKKEKKRKKVIVITATILAVVVVAGIAGYAVSHPKRVRFDYSAVFGSQDMVTGVDVSHHNGKIDWDTLSDNTDFAFIRGAYRGYGTGKIITDSTFKKNIKGANKANMPVGVYFYTQAVNKKEAQEEARYVLDLIKGYNVALPIVIDYEYPYSSAGDPQGRMFDAALSNDDATDIINAFCKEISDAGYTPGVYAASSTYSNELNAKNISSSAVIWVADYNSSVTYAGEYDIWQCSKTGSVDGISSSGVDIDKWYLN